MADLKISQLPSATTPLAGTEVLPIVQSNATKQVSISNLTAGRSVSVADATLTTGNLVIGTFGKGITGGTVVTTTGATSVNTATATTLFALPSTTRVCSLQLFCNILDAPGSNSYAVIVFDRTNARLALTGNDTNLTISLSGINVQVTQVFGSTQSVDWGYILSKNT